MKKILLVVHPKWCEKIFSGEKTIEVRRNRPKLEPPFTVYVHCTKAKNIREDGLYLLPNDKELYLGCKEKDLGFVCWEGDFRNGKVIGSFICDRIFELKINGDDYGNYWHEWDDEGDIQDMCLFYEELETYLGKSVGHGWHITEPKLFDKPKELSEFGTVCNRYEIDECDDCPYLQVYVNSYPCDDCVDTWCGVDNIKSLTRPPQSWCYVEER